MKKLLCGLLLVVVIFVVMLSVPSALADSGGGKSYLPLVFGAKSVVVPSPDHLAAFAWQDQYGEKIKLVRSNNWGLDELAEFRGPNPLPDEWAVFESKDTGSCVLYRLYSVRAVLLLQCKNIAGDPKVLYTMYNPDTLTNLSAVSVGDKLLLVWQEGRNVIYSAQLTRAKGKKFEFVVLDSRNGFAPVLGENGEVAFYNALSGSAKIGLYLAESPLGLSSAELVDSWDASPGIIGDDLGQMIAVSSSGFLAYSWAGSGEEYPVARGMVVREMDIHELSWYEDTTLLIQTGKNSIPAVIHACSLAASAWRCVPLTNGYDPVRVGVGLIAHLYMDSSPIIDGDGPWAKPCITKLFPRVETICLDDPYNADYADPHKVLWLN